MGGSDIEIRNQYSTQQLVAFSFKMYENIKSFELNLVKKLCIVLHIMSFEDYFLH